MTESRKLSRRDWFRLKVPHQNRMLDERAKTEQPDGSPVPTEIQSNGLTPIEHPENHVGLDLASLPPMREAILSADQVEALFTDIEKLGSDIMLMQRTAGAQRADATKVNEQAKLELAKSALLSGSIPRIQIRYRWQDQQWIDTLKRESDGFHIVRIAHQVS